MSKVVSEVEENVEKGTIVESQKNKKLQSEESGKRKRKRKEDRTSEGVGNLNGGAFTGCKLCFYLQKEGKSKEPSVGRVGELRNQDGPFPWTYAVKFDEGGHTWFIPPSCIEDGVKAHDEEYGTDQNYSIESASLEKRNWDDEGLRGTLLGKFGCFSFDGEAAGTKYREELKKGQYLYVGYVFCFGLTPCNMEYVVEEQAGDKLGKKYAERAREADGSEADAALGGGRYRFAFCDGDCQDVDPLSAEAGVILLNRMLLETDFRPGTLISWSGQPRGKTFKASIENGNKFLKGGRRGKAKNDESTLVFDAWSDSAVKGEMKLYQHFEGLDRSRVSGSSVAADAMGSSTSDCGSESPFSCNEGTEELRSNGKKRKEDEEEEEDPEGEEEDGATTTVAVGLTDDERRKREEAVLTEERDEKEYAAALAAVKRAEESRKRGAKEDERKPRAK